VELSYDWRSFHSMFYPKRRSISRSAPGPSASIYAVVEGETVLSVFAENEDLSEWIGSTYGDLSKEMAHREIVMFKRDEVDQWLTNSLSLPHFYDQIENIRRQAKSEIVSKKGTRKAAATDLAVTQHFLLEAIQSWWGKVLPSAYGVFIRVEGHPGQDFFMVVRRGRVDSFHEPDLSSMGPDRCRQSADVVKYLSEKNLVPVQGIFVSAADWAEWSETANPWKKVAASVRENRARLVPFRWAPVTLMATRAFFGI